MGILSMTGFGSGAARIGGRAYRVEIRSVNHKGLSLRMQLPPELSAADLAAQRLVRDRLGRGAVDVSVRPEGGGAGAREVRIDRDAADAVVTALQDLASHCGTGSPTLDTVLRYGNVIELVEPTVDAEDAEAGLLAGLAEALDGVDAMRAAEGAALGDDMRGRLDRLSALLDLVEEAAPAVLEAFEARLMQRFANASARLGLELDPARVAAELIVFSDRSDVTEEVVRARTHIERFRAAVDDGSDGERGKRLDFLSQELLREFNTMGSKCRDVDIAGQVIEAKIELEKIREQAQNVA